MESFGEAFDRLTRQFVADVVEAVRAELAARAPKPRAIVRRIVRIAERPVQAAPVVTISPFEIPVGRPRARRRSGPRRPRETTPPPMPKEQTATFQVVPHPDRTGRRLVITRLG